MLVDVDGRIGWIEPALDLEDCGAHEGALIKSGGRQLLTYRIVLIKTGHNDFENIGLESSGVVVTVTAHETIFVVVYWIAFSGHEANVKESLAACGQ